MLHKNSYSQFPTVVYQNRPKVNLISLALKWIKNFLAIFGLLLIGGLWFLYSQGQQVASSFNDEFVSFFGSFVEQVLKKDVASAMVIKTPLEKGVTIKQAIHAMEKYANKLNIKLIAHYPLFKEFKADTQNSLPFVEIFELFDTAVTASLLEHNPDFAAYLPYRIVLYKDNHGQVWFTTLNIELLFHGMKDVDYNTKVQALKIQENLLKIMGAGAYGTL